jgi:hypothetical protein
VRCGKSLVSRQIKDLVIDELMYSVSVQMPQRLDFRFRMPGWAWLASRFASMRRVPAAAAVVPVVFLSNWHLALP